MPYISIPGLGIAGVAALGLAKVDVVGVTIFDKVTEGFFKMAKNPPRKLQEVCCCNRVSRIHANRIYSHQTKAFIISVSLITACLVWSNFHSTLYSMQKQTHIYYS